MFNKAICEVMLEQRYFNGIGNYLRAEILHRASVHPFTPARTAITDAITMRETKHTPIVEDVKPKKTPKKAANKGKKAQKAPLTAPATVKPDPDAHAVIIKQETDSSTTGSTPLLTDLLSMCKTVMEESLVILRRTGFDGDSERGEFTDWLQCYMKMDHTVDSIGRTIWYSSTLPIPRGVKVPKAPKNSHRRSLLKSPIKKKEEGVAVDDDDDDDVKPKSRKRKATDDDGDDKKFLMPYW